MRVLISGGGTGGHVYPALAVAQALQEHAGAAALSSDARPPTVPASSRDRVDDPSPVGVAAAAGGQPPAADALLVVGSDGGVEANLVARAGLEFQAIQTGQLRGRAPWIALRNLARMRTGARQAGKIIDAFRPDVCFATGGYVCAPVVWAASRAHVPILIYLPDLEPGMAIRVLSRLATRVAVSFPEALSWFGDKGVVTGYPVRAEFGASAANRTAARAHFGLEAGLKTVLVFGGSRGSRSINQAVSAALPQLLAVCQVIHVSGTLDWDTVQRQAAGLPATLRARYHAVAYLHDDMAQAMAAADLAVTRAGASTLGEFPVMGLPSILVPYPYAGQHQDVNADFLVHRGAAIKLADQELAGHLTAAILGLLGDDERLARLAAGARQLAQPGAAQAIAAELRQLVRNAA